MTSLTIGGKRKARSVWTDGLRKIGRYVARRVNRQRVKKLYEVKQ
jgi:hypothetical protein